MSGALDKQKLTSVQQNMLRMIVGGMTDKEIAFAVDISENSVVTEIEDIFNKIGASDRTSATTVAIKQGFVRVDL